MNTVEKHIDESLPKTVRSNTEDNGTLIGLPKPYNVPCTGGSFQEMYYWDTYFLNRGLIIKGLVSQAKNNIENMMFLVEKYGYMPNGNRTYYLKNSQPPFLSMMVDDVFTADNDIEWLRKAYKTLLKEYGFWMTKRMTPIGLNQYKGNPEIAIRDRMCDGFLRRIGARPENITDDALSCQYVAICESGWDITPRFGFHIEDFCEVELNSLLFAFEKNMSKFSRVLGISGAEEWEEKAQNRKVLMEKYMLKDGIFYDYDFRNGEISDKFTCASYYVAVAGLASKEQAKALKDNLFRIETDYGVAVTEKIYDGGKNSYQWQYPNGWAPLHNIVYRAMLNYGFSEDAKRIARKYANLVETNFEKTGNLWEKYNVVTGGNDVKAEKTNSGADMPAMMGWTAGAYIEAKKIINEN
ncbi:MAG TPA: alpha,alpha-trehalase [Ruminococcaceae bacterium]|nr:alpha,alpha-trehalase [Oscillospiraceae bacterium]